jgi:vacuolar-type H+-ATPase subunit E/Vma4
MGKEPKERKKEITIIGIVREIEDKRNPFRVGIATGDEIYVVKLNDEGKNLSYEVGNKVEATGIITETKDGRCRIDVSGYEVYEMDEEDLEEFGFDFDWEVK